jgi:hypothetical protein
MVALFLCRNGFVSAWLLYLHAVQVPPLMRPLKATYIRKTRKNKREVVSRSFRIPPQVDKLLAAEAKKKGWTKSFLIRDILFSWYTYQNASAKVEGVEVPNNSES